MKDNTGFYIFIIWLALYIGSNIGVVYLNLRFLPDTWLFLGYLVITSLGIYHEYKDYQMHKEEAIKKSKIKPITPPTQTQIEVIKREDYTRINDYQDYF